MTGLVMKMTIMMIKTTIIITMIIIMVNVMITQKSPRDTTPPAGRGRTRTCCHGVSANAGASTRPAPARSAEVHL